MCRDISYLFFGFATILWITLFVLAFQRFAVGHNAGGCSVRLCSKWLTAAHMHSQGPLHAACATFDHASSPPAAKLPLELK